MRKQLIIVLLFLASFSASSQYKNSSIGLFGNLSYSLNFATKSGNIKIPKVSNDRNGGTSGTLYLTVWLVEDKYYGSLSIEGYKVAEKRLGELKGGYYYSNLDYDLTWEKDFPAGRYYVVFRLTEYSPGATSNYVFCDYLCFDKRVEIEEEDEDEDWK